jgi:hypothetical protein
VRKLNLHGPHSPPAGGILVFGVGLEYSKNTCTAAIYLCILFYSTSKFFVYAFLGVYAFGTCFSSFRLIATFSGKSSYRLVTYRWSPEVRISGVSYLHRLGFSVLHCDDPHAWW